MEERPSGILVKPLRETEEVVNTTKLFPKAMMYPKRLARNMDLHTQTMKLQNVIRMRNRRKKDQRIVPTCCSSSTVRNTVEGT